MSTSNIYKIIYHGELNGKKFTEDKQAFVSIASTDYNSIKTVLSNNGLLPQGTLQIQAVQNVPSGPSTFYS